MAKVGGKGKSRPLTRSQITELVATARQHFEDSRYDDAAALLEPTLAKKHEGGREATATLLILLGRVELERGDFKAARRHHLKAVSILQQSGKPTILLARALAHLGETYYDEGNFERLLPLAERALAIYESKEFPHEDEWLIRWLYESVGYLYDSHKRYAEAARTYHKLLEMHFCNNEDRRQALARVGLLLGYSGQQQKAYREIHPRIFKYLRDKFVSKVPPSTRCSDDSYKLHGETIANPYGWLEDLQSQETIEWRKKQSRFAQLFFDCSKYPGEISQRLYDLHYVRYAGMPSRINGKYFYFMRPADSASRKWCTSKKFMVMPKILLDEECLGETEKLTDVFMSPDGKWLAYGISESGSEWQTWRIRNIESGRDLKERLQEMTVAYVVWDDESSGFYYGRFQKPHRKAQYADCKRSIYFHKLGTSQKQDVLVYEPPNNEFVQPYVSGKYFFVYQYSGMACTVLYRTLSNKRARLKAIGGGFVGSWRFVGMRKDACMFITDWKADRGRIVAVNMKTGRTRQVVPESSDKLLGAVDFGDCWVLHYMHDACSRLIRRDHDGTETVLPTPAYSKIDRLHWFDEKNIIYDVESFSQRPSIRLCDIYARKDKLFYQTLPDSPSPEFVTSKRVVKSKDATRLLVFISHKKGLKINAKTPLWLTGYGGFGVDNSPAYAIEPTVWMELGGIYAVAVIRGGGEFGRAWHHSVLREKRPKVFEDFIAVAEWLIKNGYTRPSKLGISGGSNGGLLVAACLLKRPELFGAVVISNAILDMLRNEYLACGINWITEYGSVEKKSQYKVIRSYSPLQNVVKRAYPPTLIQVGDTDDLVHPSNSYKFGAALQAAHQNGPIYVMTYANSGHSGGARSSWQGTHEAAFLYSHLTGEF
jgi:prolyl oligopeptidase